MTTVLTRDDTTPTTAPAGPGVVTGRPRTWLRVEGLALAAAGLVVHSTTGAPWWLVPALFLVPDLFALGYLAGNRVGAWTYNLAHTAPLSTAGSCSSGSACCSSSPTVSPPSRRPSASCCWPVCCSA